MVQAGTYSGFARFPSMKARADFVRKEVAADPDLQSRATLAGSRPEIVFEGLTQEQLAAVERALEGRGQWFGDVQFGPAG